MHIINRVTTANAAKVWTTQSGKSLLCHNNSRIPDRVLRDLMDVIEARSQEVMDRWYDFHNEIRFYC